MSPDPTLIADVCEGIVAAVQDYDPGDDRDAALRALYRQLQNAGALQAPIRAMPEGWPTPPSPLTAGELAVFARGVRLEGEPPA